MAKTHHITTEQFLANVNHYLDLVKPGDQVEIGKKAVLICPKDLRFMDKVMEVVDELPVGLESLIDMDDDDGEE